MGISDRDIATIEERLGVALPENYADALRAGVLLNDQPPGRYFYQDAIEILIANLELRMCPRSNAFGGADWPFDSICIGDDECGNYFCIGADDPTCQVLIFNHEENGFEPIAASLRQYLADIASMLANLEAYRPEQGLSDEPQQQTRPSSDAVVARTRKPRESVLDPITREEWEAFVAGDPDLQMIGYRTGVNPFTNEEVRFEAPGLAVLSKEASSFQYAFGRITVDRPGPAALAKLEQIAQAFGANVIRE